MVLPDTVAQVVLSSPYLCVRDLGRLAIASPTFGRRRLNCQNISLVEEVMRCRCRKLQHGRATLNIPFDRSAWSQLICLTEPTEGIEIEAAMVVDYDCDNDLHRYDVVVVPHGVMGIGEDAFSCN